MIKQACYCRADRGLAAELEPAQAVDEGFCESLSLLSCLRTCISCNLIGLKDTCMNLRGRKMHMALQGVPHLDIRSDSAAYDYEIPDDDTFHLMASSGESTRGR